VNFPSRFSLLSKMATESAASSSSSSSSTPGSVFHTNRTAALVPKEARNKSLLRKAIHEFADQFAAVLAHRLISYCQLRNSKTVDVKTLKRAAEDLLGSKAGEAPEGVSEADIPQTMIFTRFKKSLGGLRMEGGCANVASSIGFNFLSYVQGIVDGVYAGAADPKAVEAEAVIAQLEKSHGHSPAGLPCIAYRPGLVVNVSAAPKRKSEAAGAGEGAAASSSPKKASSKKAAAAAAAPAAPAPAPAPAAAAAPTKGKKRAAKVEQESGAGQDAAAAAVEDQEAKPKAASKKAKGGAAAAAGGAGAGSGAGEASEPKRRKKAAVAAAE
jgi:hypothetical protein